MNDKKPRFTLNSVDNLFTTQEQRDNEQLVKIRELDVTKIDQFPKHPYKVKNDADMYNLMESIRIAATLLKPFLPDTAEKIFRQMNVESCDWDSLEKFGFLKAGHTVGKPEILFARIDKEKMLKEIEEKNQNFLGEF